VKRKFWISGVLLLAAVITVSLLLLPSRGQENTATVAEAINRVDAHPRPKEDWQPAVVGMIIYGDGQVRTGSASWARLELPEGVVRLSADSIFTVKSSVTRRGRLLTTLFLQEGRLWINLTTDKPHQFTVETGNAVAAVRDTRFSVRVTAGETLLSVAEGKVDLTAQEQSVTVVSGQQAIAQLDQPPAPPEPMSEKERSLWAIEGGMPELAPPTPIPTPTGTPTPTRTPTLTPTPVPALLPGWTSYTNANYVNDIAFDRDGNLWAAGSGGVVRWDLTDGTYTKYTVHEGLPGNDVRSIALAPDGTLWIGVFHGGVSRFDGQTWTTYGEDEGPPLDNVLSIAMTPDGALWVGTSGGVSRFDGQTWTTYTQDDGLAHFYVQSIAVAPDGALWVGTPGGVSRFDGQTWTAYTEEDGLVRNAVQSIAAAPNGTLWFGTPGGVSRFDGQTWTAYTEEGTVWRTTTSGPSPWPLTARSGSAPRAASPALTGRPGRPTPRTKA
jgi:sugar lactone lactonase YvrE